jgi:hypothetical protein
VADFCEYADSQQKFFDRQNIYKLLNETHAEFIIYKIRHIMATYVPFDLETETQMLTIVEYAPASALLHFCIAAMTLSLVSWPSCFSAIASAISVLSFPSRICKEVQRRV